MKFLFSYQSKNSDCGPTCLKMVASYHGRSYDLDFLNKKCHITKVGTSMLKLSRAAKAIGFECRGVKMGIEQLKEIVQQIPVILHWNKNHFVVIYKAPKPMKQGLFYVADPAKGFVLYKETEFAKNWLTRKNGYCLLIESK